MDQLVKLLEKLTTSGKHNLKELEQEMKELKKRCKVGGQEVTLSVFRILMTQIGKKHSQVRLTTLLVMNELFIRSHSFRALLVKPPVFDEFLGNIGVIGERNSLPPPKDTAKQLVAKSLEIINIWNSKFGPGYPLLANAYKYMCRNGVDFSSGRVLSPAELAQLEKEKEKKKEFDLKKKNQLLEEFQVLENESRENMKQFDNCLEIICPSNYDDQTQNSFEGIPAMNKDSTIQIHVKNVLEVAKNKDSEDVLNNIKDLNKLLVKDNLPRLKKLTANLTSNSTVCDGEIKKAIDLKNDILKTISKYVDLKVIESSEEESSSEEDDFDEVERKEELETIIPDHERALYGLEEPKKKFIKSLDPNKRTCNVPLPSGKLCPRMDSVKCPFHGIIVERDEEGNVLNEKDFEVERKRLANKLPDWQEPSLLRDIEAATGIDLRVKSIHRNVKKRKYPGLKDVRNETDSRKKISKKIFNKEARLKVSNDLDSMDNTAMKKFEDNWAYALNR